MKRREFFHRAVTASAAVLAGWRIAPAVAVGQDEPAEVVLTDPEEDAEVTPTPRFDDDFAYFGGAHIGDFSIYEKGVKIDNLISPELYDAMDGKNALDAFGVALDWADAT